MRRNVSFAVALLVLFVANICYNAPRRKPAADGPPRFLHCSECTFESPYLQSGEGRTCSKCKIGKLQPASHARGDSSPTPLYRDPLALGLIGTTVLLSAVHIYLLIRSRQPRSATSVSYFYCRCTTCKRRVRYEPRPHLHVLLCPTCRTELKPATTAS